MNTKEHRGGKYDITTSNTMAILNILTHTSNAKCFSNITLINIRGLAISLYRSGAIADLIPIGYD